MNVARTTEMKMETDVLEAGVANIPFIELGITHSQVGTTFLAVRRTTIDPVLI